MSFPDNFHDERLSFIVTCTRVLFDFYRRTMKEEAQPCDIEDMRSLSIKVCDAIHDYMKSNTDTESNLTKWFDDDTVYGYLNDIDCFLKCMINRSIIKLS